jgi:hypothetical protein
VTKEVQTGLPGNAQDRKKKLDERYKCGSCGYTDAGWNGCPACGDYKPGRWRKAERQILRRGVIETEIDVSSGVRISPHGCYIGEAMHNEEVARSYKREAAVTVLDIEKSIAEFAIKPRRFRIVIIPEDN